MIEEIPPSNMMAMDIEQSPISEESSPPPIGFQHVNLGNDIALPLSALEANSLASKLTNCLAFLNPVLGSMDTLQAYLVHTGVTGDKLPYVDDFVLFIDIILRSISEVFLCNNPLSGLLICIALWKTSVGLLAYCLLGAIVSTIAARLVIRPSKENMLAGLCGYNGTLTGGAVFTFFKPSHSKLFVAIWLCALAGVVAGCCSNFTKVLKVPAFTAAFNLIIIPFLISVNIDASAVLDFTESADLIDQSNHGVLFVISAILKGVSQFIFVDTILGALLVVTAIALYSR